jgi:hypothetical protein
VDRHPTAVVEDQHDDLKDVACQIGSEDEKPIGSLVVAEVVNRQWIVDDVTDVVVSASVAKADE